MLQSTHKVAMVRPVAFSYNPETAISNSFQNNTNTPNTNTQVLALQEFNNLVEILQKNGVEVVIFEDTLEPLTPDSIFPNNWISLHTTTAVLYPMCASNRRLERKESIYNYFIKNTEYKHIIHLEPYEAEAKFLEGTGSLVLDRVHKIAYMCRSIRADVTLAQLFCKEMEYQLVDFEAVNSANIAIYHTNVLLCVGTEWAVICLECIPDSIERGKVVQALKNTHKTIIEISIQQMNNFAGNMLEITTIAGKKLVAMSGAAYNSLTDTQKNTLQSFAEPIVADIPTIEYYGGGSVRCMLLEIF